MTAELKSSAVFLFKLNYKILAFDIPRNRIFTNFSLCNVIVKFVNENCGIQLYRSEKQKNDMWITFSGTEMQQLSTAGQKEDYTNWLSSVTMTCG